MARDGFMRMRTAARALAGALGLLALLALPSPARAQGVHAALVPAVQIVTPGDGFDVELDVTQAGSPFNGFRAVVSYDPTALTFVPLAPLANQQGCLMTGLCSAACGSTFHTFVAAGDSLVANDVLLCDQFTLTGPGALYKLHFVASNVPQITFVRIRRATFYDAGLFVTPVTTADCEIGVGLAAGVGGTGAPNALRLRAEPNPAWGSVAFALVADRAGEQSVDVLDLSGRLVRRVTAGWQPAGARTVRWDGIDGAGRPAPAGVYLVRLRAGEHETRTRIALLR